MASEHNPFRRKNAPTSLSSSTPQPVTTSAFLESITSGMSRENVPPPPDVRPAKAKVVKRVRVLSPPPSSPSSPESIHSRGFGRQDDTSDDPSDDDNDDQFSKRFPELSEGLPAGLPEAAPLRIANANPNGTPENPFGKTLQDLDGLTTDAKGPSGGTGKSLDVNAFKMLLLTGQAGAASPASEAPAAATASDTSGPDTPRSSQDTADRGGPLPSPLSTKKKPPPPSSRHGRKISIQPPGRPHVSSEAASPISPSDVNKPLPPAPSSRGGDETEDVFAREAAGKVPEQDSPTPSSTPTSALPASGKKPTPAPPPRRGHARSQSLTASAGANAPSTSGKDAADTPPRSSLESQRSRSESFRSVNAPAPPPPRRPNASHRQSFQLASPSAASFNASSALAEAENPAPASGYTPPKISPPPPPPARNPSTRRPPSVRSFEATSRKVSGVKEGAPPPPPPRQRGSSRGSMDGYPGARRPSIDSTRAFGTNVPEEPGAEGASLGYVGKGADILADLDALQREVDALRAQQAK
ncbi:hypothetical protein CPLU01_15242 [Colletotrichum plurivorum]|uniref:Uncharacterized protein n=1 Tax=Colletotrichum plurivorum TaxID=2175906 RepID=A0A8H6MVQ7_9PEZI|nr:hypothetical protein CPLU01_15242 [Colletotrichum plurivorum]